MTNILLLDIETAPNLGYFWRIWKENIGTNQIVNNGHVLSWAAKWLGNRDMMFGARWKDGERPMLARVHHLLNEADIVVHYNGKSFDIPTLNKEFILHDFPPPAPYKQVDLLLVVRDTFAFVSNKLDYVSKTLGMGEKVRHPGFELWVKTMNGDAVAQRQMERYNRRDVVLLERLYLRLRPWIKNHPNVNYEATACPNCGSKNFQRRGTAIATLLRYQRYQCQNCATWFRGTKAINVGRKERYTGIV